MLLRDFQPFVMPFVVGCPSPVLEHHARLVCADWCRKTLAYTLELDPVVTDGTAVVEMEPESRTQIVKVTAVTVAGREWEVVDAARGRRFARCGHSGEFCFTQDNKILSIYPLQSADAEVVVTAALMPDPAKAISLDDSVANLYVSDIAEGIIASIMRVPNQAFSNPKDAMTHQGMYESRRSTIAAKLGRKQSSVGADPSTKYL